MESDKSMTAFPPTHRSAVGSGFDEDRAAQLESMVLASKVKNLMPVPHWIAGTETFWLKKEDASGHRFIIVDAQTGDERDAFDHDLVAQKLSDEGLTEVSPDTLPIEHLDISGSEVSLLLPGEQKCVIGDGASDCSIQPIEEPQRAERRSPDGKQAVYAQNCNLWLRSLGTGETRQLTLDGEAYCAYGELDLDVDRVNRRRLGTSKPLAGISWSPEGRYLATFRVDRRAVPLRTYVTEHLPPDLPSTAGHLDRIAFASEGIRSLKTIEIFDTHSDNRIVAKVDSAELEDFASVHFSMGKVWWSSDGASLFVVGATFGGSEYMLKCIDVATGDARDVIREAEEHFYAFAAEDYNAPNFHVTDDGREAIWYSQRSGAGHLYLYDAITGELKNAITDGIGVVFDLIRVDEAERRIYFTAGGREEGRNPYYQHLYSVSFDGGSVSLLTPEDAVHEFTAFALPLPYFPPPSSLFSPSGDYFVDVFSTLQQPPAMVIRRADGSLIAEVLRADISALKDVGWQAPESFVVKAADGETDLYGAMYFPPDFDPDLSYAVVDQTYPGPQMDAGPKSFVHNFMAFPTANIYATAATGMIAIALDGRGTTRRDRKFRYAHAGSEDIFGACDHKAAIENLAADRPYLDVSRVGIAGASFGGYGSLRAALLYPDFFKVVVSYVGPHEYRNSVFSGWTNERFFGVPASDRDHHDLVDSLPMIERLEADLMLIYGEIDENVPLRSAMTIFDALIKADKDFVSYVLPNADHLGAQAHPYVVKRQRRFFREHLGGPTQ